MTESTDESKTQTVEPSITIGEEQFEILPLGVAAMAPLARLMMKASEQGKIEAADLVIVDEAGKPVLDGDGNPTPNAEKIGRFLIAAVGFCEDEILELLSQTIAVPVEELKNPRRFPLAAIAQLVGAVVRGVDFTAFLPVGQLARAAAGGSQEKATESPGASSPSGD